MDTTRRVGGETTDVAAPNDPSEQAGSARLGRTRRRVPCLGPGWSFGGRGARVA